MGPLISSSPARATSKATIRARWRASLAVLVLASSLAVGAVPGWVAPAFAQTSAARPVSRPVVQPLPGQGGRLNAALGRLGRNPRDVEALIDAGGAAIDMGDTEAAVGFFKRADQVVPGNPRVLAGLASATVRNNDPVAAIALFDQAEKAGARAAMLAGDRGLAYDLVGDNAQAQRHYRLALANGANAEVTRRLALSQAIAGDQSGAEATLLPLLQMQDKAGWRTRAFVLAILGKPDEAVTVAKSLLPPDLATAISPYLRYMPRLTRAQQAAAANFGAFPRASEIGVDDPRIAALAPPDAPGSRVAGADQLLVPGGEPLGRKPLGRKPPGEGDEARPSRAPRDRGSRAAALAARAAPPEPVPARQAGAPAELPAERPPVAAAPSAATTTRPPVAAPASPTAVPAFPDLARITEPGRVPPPPPAPAPPAAPPPATPPPAAPPPAAPPPAAPPPATPPPRISLSEAFSDLGKPAVATVPAPGAVDITRIAPAGRKPPQLARPAPTAAPPKAPPPTHPSRIWVQLGIGRDKQALAWGWRRLARQVPDLFRGWPAFVSDSGPSNRMLAGPFGSEAAASAFVAQLERARVVGPFVWVSPAGQVVDSLDLR